MPPEELVEEQDNNLDSSAYEDDSQPEKRLPGWIKVSAIAAASALIGGLAAAWFYRQTLFRLRQAGQNPHDSDFGIKKEQTDVED